MKWVVRFEADGYFEDDSRNEGCTIVGVSQSLPEMPAAMMTLSLEHDSVLRILKGVTVIQKIHLVSPASITEVKWADKNGRQFGKKMPQCWFSQTKHVFVGHHKDGLVEDRKWCLFCEHREDPRVMRGFKSDDSRLVLFAEVKERYWQHGVRDSGV
jgi:hypothetical protein